MAILPLRRWKSWNEFHRLNRGLTVYKYRDRAVCRGGKEQVVTMGQVIEISESGGTEGG